MVQLGEWFFLCRFYYIYIFVYYNLFLVFNDSRCKYGKKMYERFLNDNIR